MTEDELRTQITDLTSRINELSEQRRVLWAILDGPRVLAVAHYERYRVPGEEAFGTVGAAVRFLLGGMDAGDLWGDFVSVGGATVVTHDQLDDWAEAS